MGSRAWLFWSLFALPIPHSPCICSLSAGVGPSIWQNLWSLLAQHSFQFGWLHSPPAPPSGGSENVCLLAVA